MGTQQQKSTPRRRQARSKRYASAQDKPRGARRREGRRALSRLQRPRFLWGRLAALGLVAGLVTALAFLFLDDRFYVTSAEVSGLTYSDQEAVIRAADVQDYSLFWINTRAAQERIEGLPYVRRATVRPVLPDRVRIQVIEREPEAVWRHGGSDYWVDVEGVTMPLTSPIVGLPILEDLDGSSLDGTGRVDVALIAGIRQISQLLPDVRQLAYNREHGLHFREGSGTMVYLGEPHRLAERIQELSILQNSLIRQGQVASEINLRYEGGYYYRLLP
jgi:cell division protein FtsQ